MPTVWWKLYNVVPLGFLTISQADLDAILSGMPEGRMVRLHILDEHGGVAASLAETASPMLDQFAANYFAWIILNHVRCQTFTFKKEIAGRNVQFEIATQYEDN